MQAAETKRFMSVAEYSRVYGLSQATVRHLIHSNQVRYITTESGHKRIDTGIAPTDTAVNMKYDEQCKLIAKLCEHLGVNL